MVLSYNISKECFLPFPVTSFSVLLYPTDAGKQGSIWRYVSLHYANETEYTLKPFEPEGNIFQLSLICMCG